MQKAAFKLKESKKRNFDPKKFRRLKIKEVKNPIQPHE